VKENSHTESSFWEKDLETLPREDLENLQVKRLKETVKRALGVPFYKDKFDAFSIAPEKIESVGSIKRLPLTTKDDLRDHWPYGLLAVPREDCVRVHASSGTTGKAVGIFHTEQDIENWSNLVARCLYGVGVRRSDVFQNMAGYGLFTGGLGFHYGAQKIGALTIPSAAGNSKRQIKLMVDFGTTAIHIMPSFALYLMRVFEEMGVDPKKDTKLKTIFLGAEPHSEETRKRIELYYGADAYNSYGLSEMNGPGVSFECHLKDGLHIWEDNYILEVIDPEGEEPVPLGEEGELVYTTLNREAMPLIRYRSQDLASFIPEPCACGRTHCRISRIQGRVDDMIIWKGVNIFPMQIEKVLMEIPEVKETYLVTLETKKEVDSMTVQAEVMETFLKSDDSQALRTRIIDALQSELLVKPDVQLVPKGTIPVSELGKAKRVIDKRRL
jgi:phenylacetate-CoA ligase